MKLTSLLLLLLLASGACSTSSEMDKIIEDNLQLAVVQYKHMSSLLPFEKLPISFDNGALLTSGTGWWCSGFYPGSLWYLYEYSKDEAIKSEAIRSTELLENEKYNKRTHDLGFMIFCSYGNAYRLTQNPEYKAVITQASESLISRYHPLIGCIKSWDNRKWQFPVIIDNMMNLEMLTWTSRISGDDKYANIAVSHADKTIENHYRPNCSSWHVVDYDTLSGAKIGACTHQGFSDSSAWARGQSWGLYGFTMMYRETKHEAYLQQAIHIAEFLLHHPHLPSDKIPYWDYDAPTIPDAKRDVSSATIMASALIELSQYTQGEQATNYLRTAKIIIKNLSTPTYRAEAGTNGGFILKHSVGALPFSSEVDVPLSYADYYFIESLMRLRNLDKK